MFQGIQTRSEIGLLSLFEHYKSIIVGDHLKSPSFPIWVICSESHFSVLFKCDIKDKSYSADRKPLDLYYYDGLSKQDHLIKLTIDCSRYMSSIGHNQEPDCPLEHCLRTKWNDANISWNGSEKLLWFLYVHVLLVIF